MGVHMKFEGMGPSSKSCQALRSPVKNEVLTVRMDDDDDDHENDDFDGVHDLPLLEKAYKPLYEGSKTNILSCYIVDNELEVYEWSFRHISHKYVKVCNIFHHIYMIVLKVIIVNS